MSTTNTIHCTLCRREFSTQQRYASHTQSIGHRRRLALESDGGEYRADAALFRSQRCLPVAEMPGYPTDDEKSPSVSDLSRIYACDTATAMELYYLWPLFRQKMWISRIKSEFNWRLVSPPGMTVSSEHLRSCLLALYDVQRRKGSPFKIALSVGALTIRTAGPMAGSMKFFAAGGGSNLLTHMFVVSNRSAMDELLSMVSVDDILENLKQRLDESSLDVLFLTNFHAVTFTLERRIGLLGGRMKCHSVTMDHLRKMKSVLLLQTDSRNNPWSKKLCFWRCAVYGLMPQFRRHLQKAAKNLCLEFDEISGQHSYKISGGGVQISDLDSIEAFLSAKFKKRVALIVCELKRTTGLFYACVLRHTKTENAERTVYMDASENNGHFSYIQNIQRYSRSYLCDICRFVFFPTLKRLVQHKKSCRGATVEPKVRYPSCFFRLPDLITDKIYDVIKRPLSSTERRLSSFLTFDTEVLQKDSWSVNEKLLVSSRTADPGESYTKFVKDLSLISIAAYFYDIDTDKAESAVFVRRQDAEPTIHIVHQFVLFVQRCSRLQEERRMEQLSSVFTELNTKIIDYEGKLTAAADLSDMEKNHYKASIEAIEKLKMEIVSWSKTVICYAHNMRSFDLPILFIDIVAVGLQLSAPFKTIIKKNLSYILFANEFMEIRDSLAIFGPQSLSKIAKSCQLSESKWTAFPYFKMTTVDSYLNSPLVFPSYESFLENSFIGQKLSFEDYLQTKEIFDRMEPKSWESFLSAYNMSDTRILADCIAVFYRFFQSENIDLLSDGISISSLSFRLAHQMKSNQLFLYQPTKYAKGSEDLTKMAWDSVTGGPSIVYNRLICNGISRHPISNKVFRSIHVIDMTQLYLKAQSFSYPIEVARRWTFHEKDKLFHPSYCLPRDCSLFEVKTAKWLHYKYRQYKCLSFLSGRRFCPLKTRIMLDFYVVELNIGWLLQGCFPHECNKCLAGKQGLERFGGLRRRQDREAVNLLTKLNIQVRQIWECEMEQAIKTKNSEESLFFQDHWLPKASAVSESGLVQRVREDRFFGLIRCDIQLSMGYSSDERFQRFPEIFSHFTIKPEHLSAESRRIALNCGIKMADRKFLVCGNEFQSITLISPYLRLLLQHGYQVTHIYDAFDFQRAVIFTDFVRFVSENRNRALAEGALAKANAIKAVGNGNFGKHLVNLKSYSKTDIVNEKTMDRLLFKPTFKNLEMIPLKDKVLFEVTRLRDYYTENSLVLIGSFILGYAKMYMIEAWRYLEEMLGAENCSLLSFDTDSFSIGLVNGATIEESVLPEKRGKFLKTKDVWFSSNTPELGKFKLEFSSEVDSGIAICLSQKQCFYSKTTTPAIRELVELFLSKKPYSESKIDSIIRNSNDNHADETDNKYSARGIQRRGNELTVLSYLKALMLSCQNRVVAEGFKYNRTEHLMQRYQAVRKGLNPFYIKRYLADDGISTTCLPVLSGRHRVSAQKRKLLDDIKAVCAAKKPKN